MIGYIFLIAILLYVVIGIACATACVKQAEQDKGIPERDEAMELFNNSYPAFFLWVMIVWPMLIRTLLRG